MSCEDVYCGFWINWDYGRSLGATLTLPKSSGLILVSFSTILIGLAGASLWGIICYAAHQLRATQSEEDDIHHQIQILLRNATSGWSVILGLLNISWSRRNTASAVARRALPLLLTAAIYVGGLAAASLLPSRGIVSKAGDQVLSRGASCGWQGEFPESGDLQNAQDFNTADAITVEARSSLQKSTAYSRACYGASVDASTTCDTYVQKNINSTVDFNAPCPFAAGTCASPAIFIDSGFIDSGHHLGVNSHSDDKVFFRKTITCSPLAMEKYTDIVNGTFAGFTFGSATDDMRLFPQYTFYVTNISDVVNTGNYDMSSGLNFTSPATSPSQLSPRYRTSTLRNTVSYTELVSDPWFHANISFTNFITAYEPTRPYSYLGCVERYQTCHGDSCSALTGYYNIKSSNLTVPSAVMRPTQNAIFELMWKAIWVSQTKYLITFLNDNLLLANNYLWGYFKGVSAPLPDNQWQNEVVNMHNTSMALLQRRIVEYSTPPNTEVRPGVSSLSNIVPPNSTAAQDLCSQIKVRTSSYTSFSVLGIFLLISLAMLVVAVNLSLADLVDSARRRWGADTYKSWEWVETSPMQLHRMACEGRGIGPWNEKSVGVPRTQEVGLRFSLTALSLREMFSGPPSERDEKRVREDEREVWPETGDGGSIINRWKLER